MTFAIEMQKGFWVVQSLPLENQLNPNWSLEKFPTYNSAMSVCKQRNEVILSTKEES